MKEKVILSWSGGKDSVLALNELYQTRNYEMVALLAIISQEYERISMHGVRQTLLEQQVRMLGLALEKVFISENTSNEQYEAKMRKVLTKYQQVGVSKVVFGDIFLEDLRKYRENNLSKIGMKAIFPLWGKNTAELAHTFIDSGFRAVITCIDSKILDNTFIGRSFDKRFLSILPSGIDPCGENGEFHSFVYDGPIFQQRILYTAGEVVLRENRYCYCDLTPHNNMLCETITQQTG